MKSWFAKSHASASLDRALTGGPAKPPAPAFLHDSIMRAVEAAGPVPEVVSRRSAWRWLPAPLLAALLVTGFWYCLRPPPQPESMEGVGAALEMGQAMAQGVPTAAVAPLAEEWQRLNCDLDRTARFLLASLP